MVYTMIECGNGDPWSLQIFFSQNESEPMMYTPEIYVP